MSQSGSVMIEISFLQILYFSNMFGQAEAWINTISDSSDFSTTKLYYIFDFNQFTAGLMLCIIVYVNVLPNLTQMPNLGIKLQPHEEKQCFYFNKFLHVFLCTSA